MSCEDWYTPLIPVLWMTDTEIKARVGYKHITNSGLGLATETYSVTDICSAPLHPPEQTKRDVMFKVEVRGCIKAVQGCLTMCILRR